MRKTAVTINGGRTVAYLVVAVALTVVTSAAGAQDAGTLLGNLQAVEQAAGLQTDGSLSLSQRVAAAEQKVFGALQSGSLYARVGHLQTALAGGSPKKAPDTGSLQDSLPLVNAISPNFVRIQPPGTLAINQQDYLPDVIAGGKGKVFRFKTMPVPVYVNSFPDRQFVVAVVRGFEAWEEKSAGAVRFVQVSDASKARIQVVWKRLGGQADESGCLLGAHTITRYTQKGKGSVSLVTVGAVPVPVYIPKLGPKYTVPPQVIEVNLDLVMSKNKHIRYRVLQNIVTHELGHALGLLGHSSNDCDMMAPVTDEHSRLSDRDLTTLMKLYKQKVDIPL